MCAAMALGVVLGWTAPAQAAFLLACENDTTTTERPQTGQEPESACDTRADDDSSPFAPICDPQGASAVAPPRIHAIADMTFDVGRRCGGEQMEMAAGPWQQDAPGADMPVTVDRAWLGAWQLPTAPKDFEVLSLPPPTGGPRQGIVRDIEHPPR